MVRSRRCNPLIAACNCSIGNVHGPLRWSPLTASVACPGVNWYSRVGGTLYHIQGAGASGFEGLGVCRGLVAAPAAKAFERPNRQGQRRRGNLERSFLETNKKRKVKVEREEEEEGRRGRERGKKKRKRKNGKRKGRREKKGEEEEEEEGELEACEWD